MIMTSSRPYIARALYDWILENDCTPYVLVDATRRGVEVPGEYVKDGQIVLNVSPSAVRALHMGNDVLTFDGRFGGEALTITVPMEALMAIYARENGQGMVFEVEPHPGQDQELDPGIVEADSPDKDPRPSGDKPPRKKPGKPNLKVVK